MTSSTFHYTDYDYSENFIAKTTKRLEEIKDELTTINPQLIDDLEDLQQELQQDLSELKQSLKAAKNNFYSDKVSHSFYAGESGHGTRNTMLGAVGGFMIAGPIGLFAGGFAGNSLSDAGQEPELIISTYSADQQRQDAITRVRKQIETLHQSNDNERNVLIVESRNHETLLKQKARVLQKDLASYQQLLNDLKDGEAIFNKLESGLNHFCQDQLISPLFNDESISLKTHLKIYLIKNLEVIKTNYLLSWRTRFAALCGLIHSAYKIFPNTDSTLLQELVKLLQSTHIAPDTDLPGEYALQKSPINIFKDLKNKFDIADANNESINAEYYKKSYEATRYQLFQFLVQHADCAFSETFLFLDVIQAEIQVTKDKPVVAEKFYLANNFLSTINNGLSTSNTPTQAGIAKELKLISDCSQNFVFFRKGNLLKKCIENIANDFQAQSIKLSK